MPDVTDVPAMRYTGIKTDVDVPMNMYFPVPDEVE